MAKKDKLLAPVVAAPDGTVMVSAGRYARHAVLTAFEMIGGVERMAEWADENPGEFFTKLFSKTIQRSEEVDVGEGIEGMLDRLDHFDGDEIIDGDYEVVEDESA